MNDVVAVAWVYVACALWLGGDRPRGAARWPLFQPLVRTRVARVVAAGLVVGASLLWNASEPGPAAFLAVPMSVMACGTAVTLLGAVSPRALIASAAVLLPLSLVLGAIGAAHG